MLSSCEKTCERINMSDKLDISKLNKYVGELGLTFTKCQLNQFLQYYELLVEWNSFMNLTGINLFSKKLYHKIL